MKLPEDGIIGERNGVLHQPEPGTVVSVVEVLGGDVLRHLLDLVRLVQAKEEGLDVLVEPRLVPEGHTVELRRLKTEKSHIESFLKQR